MSLALNMVRRIRQLPMLLDPSSQIRRAHPRHAVFREVEIGVGEGPPACYMAADISHGGTYISPAIPAQPTDEVLVSAGSLLRDAPARIVAHRGGGSALQFLSPVHGALLTAWLTRKQGESPKS